LNLVSGTVVLGNVYAELTETFSAKNYYQDALILAKRLGNKGLEGSIFNNLGLLSYKRENIDEAKKYWERALEIAREIQDQKLEKEVLHNLSLVMLPSPETNSVNEMDEGNTNANTGSEDLQRITPTDIRPATEMISIAAVRRRRAELEREQAEKNRHGLIEHHVV
jgi:tetratricopeptide (TPR) repeat protein